MKNSRICTKCSGYIDYSNPKEPLCVNCGMRLAWDATVVKLTGSVLDNIDYPAYQGVSYYSIGLRRDRVRQGSE